MFLLNIVPTALVTRPTDHAVFTGALKRDSRPADVRTSHVRLARLHRRYDRRRRRSHGHEERYPLTRLVVRPPTLVAAAAPRQPAHAPSTSSSPEPGAEERGGALAEDLVKSAVKKDVDGRVDGEQQVGEFAHASLAVRRVVVTAAEDGGEDGVGRDARHEDDADGDQHRRDAVAARARPLGRARPAHAAHYREVERADEK